MRICVAGAGAIGGFMGGMLALAGEDVTLVTLGDHLAAIQTDGLRFVGADGGEWSIPDIPATDDFGLLGPQDVVILAVKAHEIAAVAPALPSLYDAGTVVVTVQNGIPWWYFQRHGGPLDGRRIECLDPTGAIARHIPAERIVGCVAYPAVELVAPGVLRHVDGMRFPVGELDGRETERVRRLSGALVRAGFKAPILPDIRGEIWLKAVGALAFNPISALTHALLGDLCRWPPTCALALAMMREAECVAGKLGVRLRLPIERRVAGAESVGAHRTSMLQDVEAGRRLEFEALVGAVLELGRLTETPMPSTEAIYACLSLLDRTLAEGGWRLRPEPVLAGALA